MLSTAVPGDRNIEKRFKDWIGRCHATLDKSIRFELLSDSRTQAVLRGCRGEGCTSFERITDGTRTITSNDVVRISAKPSVVGRVSFFTVPVAVREEGAYANGRVHVTLLPEGVHGAASARDYSLRRLECVLSEQEVQDHCQKEMSRLPASLRIEPMRFATGQVVEMKAGDKIPETSVSSWEEFAHHTTWPTWLNLQRSTVVVIVASLVFALLVFAMDKSLSTVLDFVYNLLA